MNLKVMLFGKLFLFVIAFLAVLSPLALSAGPNYDPHTDQKIEERINNLNTVISVKYTDKVRYQVYYYTEKHKRSSEALLGEMEKYLPIFEQFIAERNLPEELKLLPIMESGVKPSAKSHVGAVGLWQFMRPTARSMGLKMNKYVDERIDPIKATEAALDFLSDMYEIYDDWTLALAAYNCGQGNVNKAIRRAGGVKDYWEIQKYLPRETRNYIPKFIAVTYTYQYQHVYDIIPNEIDEQYLNTATAKVFGKLSLRKMSKELEMDYNLVRSLNPSYLLGYIPTSEGRNLITLPINKMYDFLAKYGSFEDLLAVGNYKPVKMEEEIEEKKEVRPLVHIVDYLPKVNDEVVVASTGGNTNDIYSLKSFKADLNNRKRTKLVKLTRGNSLSDIAVTYGVDLTHIIAWNDYTDKNPPKRGDLVKIQL